MREGLRRARDWVFTIPTLIAFGGVLVVFDPILRLTRLFSERAMSVVAQWAQRTLLPVFKLAGAKITVERSPKLEDGTAYVMVANHQGIIDIPLIGGTARSHFPKFVTKRELARWIPMVSYNVRRGGHAIIDRTSRLESVRRLSEFASRAQDRGESPVIFAEGSRSRDGRLKAFKKAGGIALLEAAPRLAVVPVAIDGSWKLLRNRLFPIPFGVQLRVRFLDPIERMTGEDPAELLDRARDAIGATLDQWRLTDAPA